MAPNNKPIRPTRVAMLHVHASGMPSCGQMIRTARWITKADEERREGAEDDAVDVHRPEPAEGQLEIARPDIVGVVESARDQDPYEGVTINQNMPQ